MGKWAVYRTGVALCRSLHLEYGRAQAGWFTTSTEQGHRNGHRNGHRTQDAGGGSVLEWLGGSGGGYVRYSSNRQRDSVEAVLYLGDLRLPLVRGHDDKMMLNQLEMLEAG